MVAASVLDGIVGHAGSEGSRERGQLVVDRAACRVRVVEVLKLRLAERETSCVTLRAPLGQRRQWRQLRGPPL